MEEQRSHTSSLFLIELTFAILFFAIASAVCVQFFVKAHTMSEDSVSLRAAVNECSSAAEVIQASSSVATAEELFSASAPDTPPLTSADSASEKGTAKTVFLFYYDKDFKRCSEKKKDGYRMTVSVECPSGMLDANIRMSDCADDEEIYSLKASHHLQRRARS